MERFEIYDDRVQYPHVHIDEIDIPPYLEVEGRVVLGLKAGFEPKHIEIPNGIIEISNEAFRKVYCVETVHISTSVMRIGNGAFFNCFNLRYVMMSDSVRSIGMYAFEGCVSLKDIRLSNDIPAIEKWTFKDCIMLHWVDMPSRLMRVGEAAFYGCESLVGIVLPNNYENLHPTMLDGCKSVQHIVTYRGKWLDDILVFLKGREFESSGSFATFLRRTQRKGEALDRNALLRWMRSNNVDGVQDSRAAEDLFAGLSPF